MELIITSLMMLIITVPSAIGVHYQLWGRQK